MRNLDEYMKCTGCEEESQMKLMKPVEETYLQCITEIRSGLGKKRQVDDEVPSAETYSRCEEVLQWKSVRPQERSIISVLAVEN